jgi:predicted GTPase
MVVAFTAAQIPGIADRRYPATLAGPRYPDGIPILDERDLAEVCRREAIDEVVFAYSDVEHAHVMHKASIALAAGADFTLLGPKSTMLEARVPVIAVSAVRTGVGKSQVARWLSRQLKDRGLRVVAIRHPMPYGNLERQAVQRFEALADLDEAQCTVEEREEYEPHLAIGKLVCAGPTMPTSSIAPKRKGTSYCGMAETTTSRSSGRACTSFWSTRCGPATRPRIILGRLCCAWPTSSSSPSRTRPPLRTSSVSPRPRALAPAAEIMRGASIITLDAPELVRGKRAIVVDDGPTLTHGGMAYGAGFLAAVEARAAEIVDPRASAVGHIAAAFAQYPHIGKVLPALGYSEDQLADLAATINRSDADVVVIGSPSDIARLATIEKPISSSRRIRPEPAPGSRWRLTTRAPTSPISVRAAARSDTRNR